MLDSSKWESVIGVEIHAQILSDSKLFSRSATNWDSIQNVNTSIYDIGFPGMLPVINYHCVLQAVKTVLGLKGDVSRQSRFDRKNYFYQDLPKGYQITQYYKPIGRDCSLLIEIDNDENKMDGASSVSHSNDEGALSSGYCNATEKIIRIDRIHIEEDAGKSIHNANGQTFVDLNRAGIGLMEIVTHPDFRSSAEVMRFLKKLRSILRALGTCDGDMQNGSLRCDANVSVRMRGSEKLGVRSEIKNLNSISNVGAAIDSEIARHIFVLENGGELYQDTRSFDPATGETSLLRSKEDVTDYCYFPDPDLPCVLVSEELINNVRDNLPELPDCKRRRYIDLGISAIDAEIIAFDVNTATYFDQCIGYGSDPKLLANWILMELFAYLNAHNIKITESPCSPENLASIVKLIQDGVISGKIAKTIFEKVCNSGQSPAAIVESENLAQISDKDLVMKFVNQEIEKHPNEIRRYANGEKKLLGFFIGEIMKASKGKVNPEMCRELVIEALNSR